MDNARVPHTLSFSTLREVEPDTSQMLFQTINLAILYVMNDYFHLEIRYSRSLSPLDLVLPMNNLSAWFIFLIDLLYLARETFVLVMDNNSSE